MYVPAKGPTIIFLQSLVVKNDLPEVIEKTLKIISDFNTDDSGFGSAAGDFEPGMFKYFNLVKNCGLSSNVYRHLSKFVEFNEFFWGDQFLTTSWM